jgi:hypothetical protein
VFFVLQAAHVASEEDLRLTLSDAPHYAELRIVGVNFKVTVGVSLGRGVGVSVGRF